METSETLLTIGKALAVGLWFLGLLMAERLWPAARLPAALARPADARRRLGRNLGLWLLNSLLSPLIVLPVTYWAAAQQLGWRPLWWDAAPGLLLDLLLLDFLIYWWHRANHVVPFLWRFHEIHHRDGFLDTTSALRFHFGEVLLSAGARAGAILILAIPFQSVLVFEALVLVAALFHHSNLRIPAPLEAFLARVVVTPSIHWVHHHAKRADTDANYATIFSLWDPLFGSRARGKRRLDMRIGVEGRPGDLGFFRLLLRPFTGGDTSRSGAGPY
jgi:sterol desaturase/sphingolipid hydroxylase (fatty acid hydroxylase superfamily)